MVKILTILDIAGLIQSVNNELTDVAWGVFALAWGIGWAIRGSPIPVFKVKKGGQDIVEDAVIAALAFAAGTTVFAFIKSLVGQI